MKKLVYLISPNKIDNNFFASLDKVLSFKNVKFFQLRLKNLSQKKLLNFSKRIIKITTKHKVKFIINDNFILASKINADGCHMGQHDGSFSKARKKLDWQPKISLSQLISEMIKEDTNEAKKEYLLRNEGFSVYGSKE